MILKESESNGIYTATLRHTLDNGTILERKVEIGLVSFQKSQEKELLSKGVNSEIINNSVKINKDNLIKNAKADLYLSMEDHISWLKKPLTT